jgi:putative membrane protein insertion efficiency factor
MRSGFLSSVPRRLALGLLWFYRHCLSGFKRPCCRFEPTCSQYAEQAIGRFGLVYGSWLTLKRVLRCHPFSGRCGYDPVPLENEKSAQKREDLDG